VAPAPWEFPRDVSVYGVRGFGGNVEEWTSTEATQGAGDGRQRTGDLPPCEIIEWGRVVRVARGGTWLRAAPSCRAADRLWYSSTGVGDDAGFRLARSR